MLFFMTKALENKNEMKVKKSKSYRKQGSFYYMYCADVPAAMYPVSGLAHLKIPWE